MHETKRTLVNMRIEDEEFLDEFFDSTHEKAKFKTDVMSAVVQALKNSRHNVTLEIDVIAKKALHKDRRQIK